MHTGFRSTVGSILVLTSSVAFPDDTVVVTATRTEQSASEVGQAISVIDAQAIETRQSDTVVELLRTVPGVSITRNGGIGHTTSVYIRGAESDHTVALIDGVKLNDPSSPGGGFNFGNLLTGNIKRIEVLRGSQSVLWGSQAIGGVINLVTAKPTDDLAADVRAEYGWRGTRQVVGNVSQRIGRVAASLGAGDFHTDGISAFSEARGGSERDGYRNFGANANIDIELTDAVSLDVRGWYSNGKVGIDGFPPPSFALGDTREYARTRELVGYTALNFASLDGRFSNRLATAYTGTSRDNVDPDSFVPGTFDAEGHNTRFEYQGTFAVTEAVRATFGAEAERSSFTTASFGGPATRGESNIDSGYAQVVAKLFTGFTAIAGIRHDNHDEFGGKTTTAASASWSPNNEATRFRASLSEGFKAPTLYQLQSEYGNGLLTPETAIGYDAGITQRLWNGSVELSATAFRRDTRDLINFISCTPPFTGICANRPSGTYDNVARARAYGVEVTVAARPVDALELQASYTHIKSENRSPGSTSFGNDLVRRPRETASVVVDYRWPLSLETGLTFTHSGASFENAANTREVGGYELLDVRFAWPMSENIELQARVENVLDEQYETLFRYGTPGRAAYAGVRLSY